MKKIRNILIVLIGLFPLICYAEENNETKWRWYTLIEKDISYETDVEQICEDLKIDYNNYFLGEWIFTKEKPLEKNNREIEETIENITLDRNEINIIKITSFGTKDQEISELNFYDENGEVINYTFLEGFFEKDKIDYLTDKDYTNFVKVNSLSNLLIELERVVNIKNLNIEIVYKKNNNDFNGIYFNTYISKELLTNSYAPYSMINNSTCEEDTCILKSSINLDMLYEQDINIKMPIYKYRDKYIKCYKEEKIYIPGYYTNLENYIKDENDYIVETINIDYNKNYKEPVIKIEEIINEQEKEDNLDSIEKEENKQISMITKDDKQAKKTNNNLFYIFLISFTILISILIILKKVKRCRTK